MGDLVSPGVGGRDVAVTARTRFGRVENMESLYVARRFFFNLNDAVDKTITVPEILDGVIDAQGKVRWRFC